MNIMKIRTNDIANGLGVRTTVFVSGCPRRCPGCFNPETWEFNAGELLDQSKLDYIIDSCKYPWIAGLTILGGEPLVEQNHEGTRLIIDTFKEAYPDKNIWCYTGYTYEVLDKSLLDGIDVLVDGVYDENLRDPSLKFKGSSNQRVIDVKRSLTENTVVLLEGL